MFQTTRGMKDTMPEEMVKQQFVIDAIRRVFQKYGFDPLDTPVIEDWALLSAKSGGGEEIKQEIYYFKDKSDREVGLRFDLTVPLGRIVAASPDLPKPFKRHHIAKVWRYDKPGANRWREFWQADIDIVGSDSMEAEAEWLRAICEIFYDLGFPDVVVKMNSRKITQAFVESLGIKNYIDVFRSIDKLDKIGEDGVSKELKSKGIESKKIDKIIEFIKLKDFKEVKKIIKSGTEDLEQILELMGEYSKNMQVDMSLVRGLEYYTSTVFEVSLGIGVSVGGGGRYDNLVEVLGGKKIPATGLSLGVDRIVSVMTERKMFNFPKTVTKIFVINVNEKVKKDVISIVNQLRKIEIPTEFDLMGRSLSKQLDYASSRGIPYVIVIGEKELKSKKAKLRNMKTGEEKEIGLDKIGEIKKLV